ncbi:hypothetical protein NDU88_000812 [Pleurodeles waltl]|uniref:Uncharacterized protein n=1 Tax=Pleurodeles waltl TaxID=8319 RepID=A0AAV7V8K1_PLEWA|nr:hypothetical protein NDU88_000812 [Pleurodeles waltl]
MEIEDTFEPEMWTVLSVSGTVVTAKKEAEQVTQNLLWFRKVPVLAAPEDEPRPEDDTWDLPPEEQEPSVRDSRCPAPEPNSRDQRADKDPETQEDICHPPPRRLGLWPNPQPSQRLRDLVCFLTEGTF